MKIKGNKGEWSEFYAFIKLLADRRINMADANLQKVAEIFYPILKLFRNETSAVKGYEFIDNGKIRILESGNEIAVVESADLKSKVVTIFEQIKGISETTFEIPVAEELMSRFYINKLSASNSKKEDIILKIHDQNTGMEPEVGFSIKSMLGSPATLLNASSATNFIFKISGLDTSLVKSINNIETKSKVRDRIKAILSHKGKFQFVKTESVIFERNLRMIDTVLPEIVAELLLAYYGDLGTRFVDLVNYLGENNAKILTFDLDKGNYEYKLKTFLYNVALGMVPNTTWDGLLRAHGGYIIVREDGEIVCYHVFNADNFRSYLFNSTKLESPSTTRHNYGAIYNENGELFIKLNLQIRFVK